MNFPWYIAWRYFFTKKSQNLINFISAISMSGIGVGAMALVVVLSAFNGIEDLVEGLYSSFNPDIKIEAKKGKTFAFADFPEKEVRAIAGVEHLSKSIEETALLKYREAQCFVTLKGVDEEYIAMGRIDSALYDGEIKLRDGQANYVIPGYGIADQLNIFLAHAFEPVYVYAARQNAKGTNLTQAFLIDQAYPSGIFAINPEFDFKYCLAPYDFSSNLFQKQGQVSSVELSIQKGSTDIEVQKLVQAVVGEGYSVKTRYEMNEILYKTNQTEKWITFFILSFILIIAAFNLLGSLTILIIDKSRDVKVLQAMGAEESVIRKVFLFEGLLISIMGGGLGIAAGLILCFLQQSIGLLKLQEGTIAEYYPIQVEIIDILAVAGIVVLIGFLTAYLPARFVVSKYIIRT